MFQRREDEDKYSAPHRFQVQQKALTKAMTKLERSEQQRYCTQLCET